MVVDAELQKDAENPSVPAEEAKREQQLPGRKLERTEYLYIGVMVLAILAIALTLGLVFGLKKEDTLIEVTATPAPSSAAPSGTPSAAPTSAMDLLLEHLPESSLEALKNYSSPQWMAFQWLGHHPNLPEMIEWRKRQLFALATFYYAFEGPNWQPPIRGDWLGFDASECFWFSSAFGSFAGDSQSFVSLPANLTPCNEQGEYQSLSLATVLTGLEEMQPFLPPEMALLTSIRAIGLSQNNLTQPLSSVMPISTLSQLKQLEGLYYSINGLTGTIPTELELFTSLKRLYLNDNSLSGPIPSQLGLLTALEDLYLGSNSLTGTIPLEVTALQTEHNLQNFVTTGNNLSE